MSFSRFDIKYQVGDIIQDPEYDEYYLIEDIQIHDLGKGPVLFYIAYEMSEGYRNTIIQYWLEAPERFKVA
jgi:hypothetical protein